MTNKEKKEYLGRYKPLDEQVNQLLLEKQEILALGTKVTPTYSDIPHKSNIGDKTSTTIEKLEEHEQKINQKIHEFIAVKSDIDIIKANTGRARTRLVTIWSILSEVDRL